MNDVSLLNKPLLLWIAALQGFALFAIYTATDDDLWPGLTMTAWYPIWTLTLALPTLLLQSLEQGNEARVFSQAALFGLLLALLSSYVGYQAEPASDIPNSHLGFVYSASIAIACVMALMYLQQSASDQPMSYPVLFSYSWHNILVMGLVTAFVLGFWLILVLWGSLFELIDIDFFAELFKENWFLFPALGLAHGIGVVVFRQQQQVISRITQLVRALFRLLLPLMVLVTVIFLLSLPFTGLEGLWSTKNGSTILLWLTAILLFFVNAVYQDGRGNQPYSPFVHRLIYLGLCGLPILNGLSFYGIIQRINQYGWSVERCWGVLVWLVLALFSVGYVWGIISRRGQWPLVLAKINSLMGLVVLGLILLANSPVLDFRKISMNSQLARVESGAITLKEFDFFYAKHHLGRPGYLALEQMKRDLGDSNPSLLSEIENPVRQHDKFSQNKFTVAEFWAQMNYREEAFELPELLKIVMQEHRGNSSDSPSLMLQVDLDKDGQTEYVVIQPTHWLPVARVYFLDDDLMWKSLEMTVNEQNDPLVATHSLKKGQVEVIKPRFNNLKIGELVFKSE